MSLQKTLINHIKQFHEVSYQEIENFVRELNKTTGRNYKMKTAERELNKSRTNKIITLKNEKGYITGYKYNFKDFPAVKPAINKQPQLLDTNYLYLRNN